MTKPDLLPEDDAYSNRDLVFPTLTQAQVDRSLSYGQIEVYNAGETIYARGTRGVDFLIVLRGSVLIAGVSPQGEEAVITIHHAGEFTGELDLFSHREALVTARAATDTEVLRISRARFQEYVAAEVDIANIIMRAAILRRLGLVQHAQVGVTVAGAGRSGATLRIQEFLTRNGYPYRLIDTDTDLTAREFLDGFHLAASDLPVVVAASNVYRNPEIPFLADVLGIAESTLQDEVFDVAVVGAGPSGLAAAVYAASEGLKTIVIEGNAPGGQAGTSSRIENYLGFPSGISGLDLASRAQTQAQKFGARLSVSRNVASIECAERPMHLVLEDRTVVRASTIVIATGAHYRKLNVPNCAQYEMYGLHYSATAIEARLCSEENVLVVGGGNSAGQAAVYLSGFAKHVHMLIRGPELAATMSEYLVQRISSSKRITLHVCSEISKLEGEPHLEKVAWTDHRSGEEASIEASHVFVMIGADPCTNWLGDCVELDEHGFVRTGHRDEDGLTGAYRTSKPGIFAVGDVRSGSIKRVASGVGEGSAVVADLHRYLSQRAVRRV
ncbi:MAG: FAD-dependent oxidoreductase [Acidobacteriaceae bacterium]|nr:FAD-dependent oxidoreductase [Acidobacteriaceae bacterium]